MNGHHQQIRALMMTEAILQGFFQVGIFLRHYFELKEKKLYVYPHLEYLQSFETIYQSRFKYFKKRNTPYPISSETVFDVKTFHYGFGLLYKLTPSAGLDFNLYYLERNGNIAPFVNDYSGKLKWSAGISIFI